MIKDFFIKKETIFILLIAIISIFFVVLGFLFLFLKPDYENTPRTIPTDITSVTWKNFSSKLIDQKITYPEYMYINEQKTDFETAVTIAEFKPQNFLTYFSNQNHFSIYPEGSPSQFFYGKMQESEFTSSTGQTYKKIEYLTLDNVVWGVLLVPKERPSTWQSQGFIWMQTQIQNRELLCMSVSGVVTSDVDCNPYEGEKIVYKGIVTGQFLRLGYEIINKNKF
jgi:hypothetical protein